MHLNILLLNILIGVLWTGFGAVTQRVSARGHSAFAFTMCNSIFVSLLSFLLVVDWGVVAGAEIPKLGPMALLMGIGGMANLGVHYFLIASMRHGHSGVSWAIGQSAMIIPFLAGALLWGDTIGVWRWVGIAGVLIALAILTQTKRSGTTGPVSGIWILLVLSAFMCVGTSQTLLSVPSRWADWSDVASVRVPLTQIPRTLACLLLIPIARIKTPAAVWGLGALASAFGFSSFLILFHCLDQTAQTGHQAIVFPIAIATSVAGMSLYSRIALREHLTRPALFGLSTICLAILLLGL